MESCSGLLFYKRQKLPVGPALTSINHHVVKKEDEMQHRLEYSARRDMTREHSKPLKCC